LSQFFRHFVVFAVVHIRSSQLSSITNGLEHFANSIFTREPTVIVVFFS
jgi:hypothetical protein